jgi:hypothetical protein
MGRIGVVRMAGFWLSVVQVELKVRHGKSLDLDPWGLFSAIWL